MFKFVFEFVIGELYLHLNPYKFGKGPSPVSLYNIDNDYIKEAADYINRNNLVNAIVLKLLDFARDEQPKESTAEVEVGKYRTIILPKSIIIGGKLIPTN